MADPRVSLWAKEARNKVEELWYELYALTRPHVCQNFWHGGLIFKTGDDYMSDTSFGLGTQCWFMRCITPTDPNGRFVAGSTQEECLTKVIQFYREYIVRRKQQAMDAMEGGFTCPPAEHKGPNPTGDAAD